MKMKFAVVMLVVSLGLSAAAQGISLGQDRAAAAKAGHVVLLSDAVDVEAGKAQVVELRFKVDAGYHINSHTPKDELLIPTAMALPSSAAVKVESVDYPKGSTFRLTIGDGETLDVYQGEFRVKLRIVAAKGDSVMSGSLRYQACDNAACFPPRSLPVKFVVKGR